jgi:hypothetical protein
MSTDARDHDEVPALPRSIMARSAPMRVGVVMFAVIFLWAAVFWAASLP